MKTKSIWGNPPKRIYKLLKIAKENLKEELSVCIVGCSDGKFLMPFARRCIDVTGYDVDKIALYGGFKVFPIVKKKIKYNYSKDFRSNSYKLYTVKIDGLVERLKKEGLEKFARIKEVDFYKSQINEKFNIVFTSCSLHYSINKMYSLEEKINKLQDIVLPGGYLYIDYMMAIEEEDFEKYPAVKFFRKKEILNYFDDNWEILYIKENNHPTFEGAHVDCVVDHFHRFGYIMARRKIK